MPNFRFTVSSNQIDFFCDQNNYQAIIADPMNPGATMPNPETTTAYFNRMVAQYIQGNIRRGKEKSREAARKAETDADNAAITVAPGVIT